MNFLYCGNYRVLKGIELSILSVLLSSKEKHHFYIFSMDVPFLKEKGIGIHKEDINLLEQVIKTYNKDSEISLIDVYQDYKEVFLNTRYKNPKYTPYSYLRLFADKYIKEDRLLYLDIDTMCYQNIEAFKDIDINNVDGAVVKDTLGRFWIARDYFNSGVMYLNMDNCKKHNVFPRAIKYLLTHRLYFADQSALYHSLNERIYLSFDYNEQRKVKDTTVIKHFCQGIIWCPFHVYNIKQWEVEKLHKKLGCHDFDNIFSLYKETFKKDL